ncbi:MAG: hypothetical protein ACLQK4_00940 [Acidimicrobiales bacterium]|jgi:hypothetical protein
MAQLLKISDTDLPRVRQEVTDLLSDYAPREKDRKQLEGAVEDLLRTRRVGRVKEPRRRTSLRSGPAVVIVAFYIVATVVARRRGYNMGGDVVVRCRDGHLFTTIWVPGASVKSLRLGWARLQRCPVGQHWTLVTPVRETDLTDEEKQFAAEHHDMRIP